MARYEKGRNAIRNGRQTAKMTKFPASWAMCQEKISHLAHHKTYFTDDEKTAFVLRRLGMCGEVYKIFVNDKNPELTAFMEAHEIGHILFGHVNNENTRDAINKIKIKAAFEKVKKHFENPEEFWDFFQRTLNNIVLDMEVNGKLFTEEEQKHREQQKAKTFGYVLPENGMGCWAPAYGFPNGLDASTYLNLILQNPEKFMEDMKNNYMGSGDGDGEGEGEEGDESNGQGSGGSNSKQSKNGKGKSKSGGDGDKDNDDKKNKGKGSGKDRSAWKFTKEELENMLAALEADSQDEAKEEQNAAMDAADEMSATNHQCGHGAIGNDEVVGKASSSKELEEMMKGLITRANVKQRRNMMYYYNRRKFGTNMLIPKITSEVRRDNMTLYVLLDVSGSISQTVVSKFIGMFQKISKSLNKKCHLILWSDNLMGDYDIKNIPSRVHTGGGTTMYRGIDYIVSKYKPGGKDALVMVSDYEDSMNTWIDSIRKAHLNNFYGIQWTNGEDDSCYATDNEPEIYKYIKTLKFSLDCFN